MAFSSLVRPRRAVLIRQEKTGECQLADRRPFCVVFWKADLVFYPKRNLNHFAAVCDLRLETLAALVFFLF